MGGGWGSRSRWRWVGVGGRQGVVCVEGGRDRRRGALNLPK